LLTLRVTVYNPLFWYVWAGFLSVLVLSSPKSQLHASGEPVDASVNVTVSGADPFTGEPLNLAARVVDVVAVAVVVVVSVGVAVTWSTVM